MSQADIERFVSTLKADSGLQEEIKASGGGLAAVVEFAKAKGYDISLDEAKAYISEQAKQELTDDQLDAVAGGKTTSAPPPVMVTAVMTGIGGGAEMVMGVITMM